MKKSALGFTAILLALVGGFLWLLSQASPEHASDEVVTIELEDNFER